VKRIVDYENIDRGYHLDFGCGPGHVLGWLTQPNFLQIGLDVSINNLRNAHRNSGALVVWGDATNMPFSKEAFDVVTESSALHHIEDWKSVISESCRVCKKTGGVLIDSEPSSDQMAWGPLAIAVFNARFPFYRILSYIKRDKYLFRNIKQAKRNLQAEIDHQPGTGFPLEELRSSFEGAGFAADIIVSPDPELRSVAAPDWKSIVLNVLSGRNPWNPRYGSFTVIAKPMQRTENLTIRADHLGRHYHVCPTGRTKVVGSDLEVSKAWSNDTK